MARIRREQFEQLARRQGNRHRNELVDRLTEDDENALVDPDTEDVLLKDSRGNVARLAVTNEGLTGLTTPEGRTFRIQRNKEGLVSALNAPGDTALKMEYSPKGELSQLAINERPILDLKQEGNSVEATFADGVTERLEVFPDRKVAAATDALGHRIGFNYNSTGDVVKVVDARGNATEFTYDEGGFSQSVRFPDGAMESFDVTSDGRLEVRLNEQSHFLVAFDDADNIESIAWSDGHRIDLKIDDEGRPVAGKNAGHEVKYEYGDNGLLTLEEQDGDAIAYAYDGEDNLVALTTPFGDECHFKYDGDDLIREILDWGGQTFSFSHHANGQLATIRFPNGVVSEIQCHATGEDQEIRTLVPVGSPIVEDTYTYDERGRVASLRRNGLRSYEYDKSGQLLTVRYERGPQETFVYDAARNRTSCNGEAATFDHANRMLSQGREAFEYDARGNLVGRKGEREATYTFNGQDHLVTATTVGGEKATYTYDAFGRRITKRVRQSTTRFIWAGRQLLHEVTTTDSGQETERRDYLYMPGAHFPLAVRINGELHCYHTDRLGTVLAMTDSQGRVVWQADYDAFGRAAVHLEDVRQPLRLLGQYHDEETNLHYNLFRYYDPGLGRYLTTDPIRFESGSLNFYQFANNDPINQSDPEGHLVFLTAVAIVAGAALVGGLIGGAVNAAMADEGQRMDAFAKGFGWGALAGAVGAAVPIVGAAAGLGAGAIAGIAVAADAVIGGIEACSEGGSFLAGAGISLAMTVGTLGLAKIPGVKKALGAVGKKLGDVADAGVSRVKKVVDKMRSGGANAAKRAAPKRKPYLRRDLDDEWFDPETGDLRWPKDDGFDGVPQKAELKPGQRIDRYSARTGENDSGQFLSPQGSSYESRALPYDDSKMRYAQYEVVKPIPVQSGKAAPWFGQSGGATQFKTEQSVGDLVKAGYLKEIN